MASKPDFSDPAKWKVVKDVTVFYEHVRRRPKVDALGKPIQGKDGKPAVEEIRVTRDDLEKAARVANHRDSIGVPSPLTIGHTRDEADEAQQPPIVGYARGFAVKYDDRRKRWVLQSTWYLMREHLAEAEKYPRVSPEYRPQAHLMDPIALLRRTPHLDLQWTYTESTRGPVLRYAMTGDWTMPRTPPTRYESSPTDPPDATASGGDDDKDFSDRVMKCMRAGYPHLDRIHKEHAERYEADGNPDDTLEGGNGNGDDTLPGGDGPPGGPAGTADDTPPSEEERLRMQRSRTSGDVVRYQRENAELRARLDNLEKDRRILRYERDLIAIKDEGYPIDVAAELEDAADMDDKSFKRHCDRIKRLGEAARGPAAQYSLDIAGAPASADKFSARHLEKAEQYMRAHPGCEWEEAEEFANGQRTLTGQSVGR